MPTQDLPDFARGEHGPLPADVPTPEHAPSSAPPAQPAVPPATFAATAARLGPPVPGAAPDASAAPMAFGAPTGATRLAGRHRRRFLATLAVGGVGALATLALLAGTGGGALLQSAVSQPTVTVTVPAEAGRSTDRSAGGQTRSAGTSDASAAQSRGVVLITTTLSVGSGAGTGMVIGADGLILTNYHVVQGSTEVEVALPGTGKAYSATVVGHDASADVALLRVDATGLETVAIDDDPVAVGDPVTAVGNAQGQDYLTAASGAITDTSDTVTVSNDSAAGSETLQGVYVADAAAQPGDSGGPLFDAETEVTAMTTAGQQATAGPRVRTRTATTVEMYAVPIATAMAVVEQIKAGQETATLRIGPKAYLGIMVGDPGVTGGGSTTAGRASGVAVSSVTAGTPAAEAGLMAGSTITAIGGRVVTSQADLSGALTGHDPGDSVDLTWTDASGKEHTATVVLAASPIN